MLRTLRTPVRARQAGRALDFGSMGTSTHTPTSHRAARLARASTRHAGGSAAPGQCQKKANKKFRPTPGPPAAAGPAARCCAVRGAFVSAKAASASSLVGPGLGGLARVQIPAAAAPSDRCCKPAGVRLAPHGAHGPHVVDLVAVDVVAYVMPSPGTCPYPSRRVNPRSWKAPRPPRPPRRRPH